MRECTLFAYYEGSSPYLKHDLYMITVHKTIKNYIVRCKKVEKYYTSIHSILQDWDVLEFTGEKQQVTGQNVKIRTIEDILNALAASELSSEKITEIMNIAVPISAENEKLLFG